MSDTVDWGQTPLIALLSSMESGSRPKGGVRGIINGVPSLGGEHLNSRGGFNFDNVKYVPSPYFDSMRRGHIQRGDLLVVKDGATTGKVSLVGDDFPFDHAVANEHLFVCRPKSIDARYLFWYLYSDEGQRRILKHFRGSAQGGITRDFAEGTLVPVAPTPGEQQELADLISSALTRAFSANDHLAAARTVIERFRQSVLAAACSGRLTQDWRSFDSDAPSVDDLPARWERVELRTLAAEGIPVSYGIVKPGPEVVGGVPYVRQQDVIDGKVLIDQLAHTSPEIAGKHSRSELREGDVLLCIIRNLRVAIVPAGIDGANITQGMVRIRPSSAVLGEYLAIYLASPTAQRWMHDRYVGLAMPRINVEDARLIPVPLPPLDEQREIVQAASQLLTLAQEMAERIDAASAHLNRSSQAVLAKAFSGELSRANA